MNILHFLIKDIFRKKTRALLTICGISVGVCVCIIMLGIGESIKNSFKDVYGKRQIDIIIQEKEQLSILLSRVDAGIATDIKRISSVGDATATLLYIHKLKASAVPVFGWEPDSFLFDAVELLRGRRPVAAKNEVMAGEALARSLDKDKETQIKIKGVTFRVVGVFKSTSPFEQYAAVMLLSDLQATIHEAGKASFINVRLKPSYRTETMMENITREIETDFPLTATMRADAFISEKTQFIVVGEQFSFLVSLITIIAVALGLANTMVASAFEKRKFLAILLALGWQKIEIAALFMFEALIVVILGGAIGIFLGFKGTGYIFGLTSIQAFVPDLNAVFMLKIVGMILGSAVVAAILPIWTTLNSDPVETIRSE
ncbi:MAG: ABC transporter permease [Candidatus Omnitrophota bacterium]